MAAGIKHDVKIDVYVTADIVRDSNALTERPTALGAAETFLFFSSNEPKVKGSSKAQL